MKTICKTIAAAAIVSAAPAFSHVVLDEPVALAGSHYKAALRVGHGCEGSPTTAITVLIPSGFRGAKPQPKAGWTLSIRREKLAEPYASHGKPVSEDVAEITWRAASPDSALPDAWFDEFVLRGTLPTRAQALWFKVLQTCAQGAQAWTQVPTAGTSTQGLAAPAALLELIPSTHTGHAH